MEGAGGANAKLNKLARSERRGEKITYKVARTYSCMAGCAICRRKWISSRRPWCAGSASAKRSFRREKKQQQQKNDEKK